MPLPSHPGYQTSTWCDHPLYVCPCGYNTLTLVKMEGHQAVCRWEAAEDPPPPEIRVLPPSDPSPSESPPSPGGPPPVAPDVVAAAATQVPPEEAPHA